MVVNDWLVQFLADMLGIPVERPQVTETTAAGAAYLAGRQAGIYGDLDEVSKLWQRQARFEPQLAANDRERLMAGWRDAVQRVTKKT
jgi:glycerol kinase